MMSILGIPCHAEEGNREGGGQQGGEKEGGRGGRGRDEPKMQRTAARSKPNKKEWRAMAGNDH